MSRALCAGLDPEMWTPESDGARLALAICRRCEGCPGGDPSPVGVIRRGVPYSDTGMAVALCACGRPAFGYSGPTGYAFCRTCAEPKIALPDVREARDRWVLKLRERGIAPSVVAAEAGMSMPAAAKAAGRARRRAAA